MSIAATILPQEDGSLDVTVSGSTGQAWTLQVLPASALILSGFLSVASSSGDGTVNMAFQPTFASGGYFAIVTSSVGTTIPKYIVSAAIDSDPWYRCLQSIASRVTAMGLSGVDARRIKVMKVPVDKGIEKILAEAKLQGVDDGSPAIIVAPVTERRPNGAGNTQVRTLYGCGVYLWQASQIDPELNQSQQMLWRNRLTLEFHEQPFPGVPGILKSTVEPGQIFPFEVWRKQYDLQTLTIRCESCERKVA